MPSSVSLYTAPGHPYNCAQSVALGCNHPELEADMKACGGGRAPEGICGALHVALLLSSPEKSPALKEAFRKEVGALTCHEIKTTAKVPCARCVEIAERLFKEL